MIIDGLLLFTGTSNGASGGISSTAYTDLPTTGTTVASNIIDLGVTSGVPSSANGGGARDIGVGDDPSLKLSAIAVTAFNATGTLQLELSGAPDSGTGTPGAYTVMWTSPVYASAQLVTAGFQLANVDVPRVVPGQPIPRFLRLRFIQASTANTTGTVEASIVIDRDDQIVGTAGNYSGYPAGINVAN
jgi:hypothetical protein